MSAWDPQPGEAEAVCAKLTVAQTRAVLRGTIGPNQWDRGPGYWPLRSALWDKGLFTTANLRDVLTPLGQAAQAHLRSLA